MRSPIFATALAIAVLSCNNPKPVTEEKPSEEPMEQEASQPMAEPVEELNPNEYQFETDNASTEEIADIVQRKYEGLYDYDPDLSTKWRVNPSTEVIFFILGNESAEPLFHVLSPTNRRDVFELKPVVIPENSYLAEYYGSPFSSFEFQVIKQMGGANSELGLAYRLNSAVGAPEGDGFIYFTRVFGEIVTNKNGSYSLSKKDEFHSIKYGEVIDVTEVGWLLSDLGFALIEEGFNQDEEQQIRALKTVMNDDAVVKYDPCYQVEPIFFREGLNGDVLIGQKNGDKTYYWTISALMDNGRRIIGDASAFSFGNNADPNQPTGLEFELVKTENENAWVVRVGQESFATIKSLQSEFFVQSVDCDED
ncbi:MAG: hypothetical protein RJQ09_14880 [Cyclobacteriaceae bacterium]